MEMPGEQLAMRMMSSLGRIDQHKVRTGKLEDDDWPRLTSAVEHAGRGAAVHRRHAGAVADRSCAPARGV